MILLGDIGMHNDDYPIKIEVIGYSGYRLNERPLCIYFQHRRIMVKTLIDRWYGQESDYFKVLCEDGNVYLLKWNRYYDIWFLLKKIERDWNLH